MLSALKVYRAFVSTLHKYKLLDGIYPCGEFRKIIERERMRSDREGQRFSIVVFDIENAKNNIGSAKHLIDTLQHRRLRLTDDIGWFDNKSIGVLLHNTGEDGSLNFIDDVKDLFSTNYCIPDHAVYIYPLHGVDKHMTEVTKRVRERFDVVTKCLIHVNDDNSSYGSKICHTTNISASGALLEAEDVLPVGAQIELNIVSLLNEKSGNNAEDDMIEITGTVLRTDESGIAVCFDNEYDVKSMIG